MAAHSAGSAATAYFDGLAVAHVQADGLHSLGSALERLGGHGGQLVHAAGSQQQASPLGGKGQRRGRADSGGGSGNEDDLVLQVHGSILSNQPDQPKMPAIAVPRTTMIAHHPKTAM